MRPWRVTDLVRREHLFGGRRSGRFVAGVHLREHVADLHLVAALAVTDDAHREVDLILLRRPPGAQVQRRHADGNRSQPPYVACPLRDYLLDDRRNG